MAVQLIPHPATPGPNIRIHVEVERTGCGDLALAFLVTGDISTIVRPAQEHPAGRKDELWTTTCFEAFIAEEAEGPYAELNLSPSLNWAAYTFTGYRKGMSHLDLPQPPVILAPHSGGTVFLGADISTSGLAFPSAHATWRMGLSAVIEETSGRKSYWALAHSGDTPDFHDAHARTLVLQAPEHSHA
jgi:hypothetical protein